MDSKYSLNEKVSKYLDGEKNNVRYIKKIDSKKYIELKEALEKAKDLAKDEKLVNKIDTLICSLKICSKEGETDVAAVKESVELLSL